MDYTDIYTIADQNADDYSNLIAHHDADNYAHSDRDSNWNSNSNWHINRYTDSHLDVYPNTNKYQHAHADANRDGHIDGDAEQYAYCPCLWHPSATDSGRHLSVQQLNAIERPLFDGKSSLL